MARKNAKYETKFDYAAASRRLKEAGPQRLYFLWGPEDYLREDYLVKLKKLCLPEGEDSFSYRRINGPELDPLVLREAVDAIPFLTERSFVEIRDVEWNRLKDAEAIQKVLADIPGYCTVALVQSAEFEPDGRLKLIKSLRELSEEVVFTAQSQEKLIGWINRRFAAAGKFIDMDAAGHLIFISGDLMSKLIPEIEKVAAYAKGEKVTSADIDAVAHHVPEADIFQLTDFISQKKSASALSVLAELMSDKSNEPIFILSLLGMQLRKLYAARLAIDQGLGSKYVMEVCAIRYNYAVNQLMRAARNFTTAQICRAVELCAEADYKMKSSSQDDKELLIETVLRIAAGETHAEA